MGGTFVMHGREVQYIQRCGGDAWKRERQLLKYYINPYPANVENKVSS
jgi:hypothetical protein